MKISAEALHTWILSIQYLQLLLIVPIWILRTHLQLRIPHWLLMTVWFDLLWAVGAITGKMAVLWVWIWAKEVLILLVENLLILLLWNDKKVALPWGGLWVHVIIFVLNKWLIFIILIYEWKYLNFAITVVDPAHSLAWNGASRWARHTGIFNSNLLKLILIIFLLIIRSWTCRLNVRVILLYLQALWTNTQPLITINLLIIKILRVVSAHVCYVLILHDWISHLGFIGHLRLSSSMFFHIFRTPRSSYHRIVFSLDYLL